MEFQTHIIRFMTDSKGTTDVLKKSDENNTYSYM